MKKNGKPAAAKKAINKTLTKKSAATKKKPRTTKVKYPSSTELLKILKKYKKQLQQYDNVWDVHIGTAIKNKKHTKELALICYVGAKLSHEYLKKYKHKEIPKSIDGLRIDVIELNPNHHVFNQTYNPYKSGVGICNASGNMGTLGIIMYDVQTSQKVGVTARHVLNSNITTRVKQPSNTINNQDNLYKIGTRIYKHPTRDIGIFKIENSAARPFNTTNTFHTIRGRCTGTKTPELGMPVKKVGAKTEVTTGKIFSFNDTQCVIIHRTNSAAVICGTGDSGAIWFYDNVGHLDHLKAIAMHTSGTVSGTQAVGLRFDLVTAIRSGLTFI